MKILKAGADYSPDARSSIVAAVLLGIVANISFIIQPGLVGGFVEGLGLGEQQAGELAAAEMFGIAIATVVLSLASLKVNWRASFLFFSLVAIAGNFVSAYMVEFTDLVLARLLSGLGHGGLISLSFSAIGLTSKTDRNIGIYLAVLLSYGAVGLLVMPSLMALVGLKGIFIGFAAVVLVGIGLVGYLPDQAKNEGDVPEAAEPLNIKLLLPALLGYLAYNISQGIVWAYLFLIGVSNGLGEQVVANALFVSQVFGVVGALIAIVVSARVVGRFAPLTIGILGGAVFIALLLLKVDYFIYLVAVCGFNLMWNKVLPFILAAISDFDLRGRVMPFALAIQMFGLAVGPYIASQIVGDGNYRAVELASIFFFVLGYILLIVPIMMRKKQQRLELKKAL